jgi:hypothetical protein
MVLGSHVAETVPKGRLEGYGERKAGLTEGWMVLSDAFYARIGVFFWGVKNGYETKTETKR